MFEIFLPLGMSSLGLSSSTRREHVYICVHLCYMFVLLSRMFSLQDRLISYKLVGKSLDPRIQKHKGEKKSFNYHCSYYVPSTNCAIFCDYLCFFFPACILPQEGERGIRMLCPPKLKANKLQATISIPLPPLQQFKKNNLYHVLLLVLILQCC